MVGDGYEKNKRLLHINPKGLVPTLEVFQSEEVKPEVIVESILVMKWLYKNCKGEQIDESKLQEAMEMDKLCCSPFYQVLMTQDKGNSSDDLHIVISFKHVISARIYLLGVQICVFHFRSL